ncbi:MAG: hypothetical protein SNJ77_06935 [Cytophagales bacterium]
MKILGFKWVKIFKFWGKPPMGDPALAARSFLFRFTTQKRSSNKPRDPFCEVFIFPIDIKHPRN